ncbi:MAG: CDP-glycerol glycerophosphotransferase family protein [Sphaerochaeta sp.]|uniref:CDP-glycerol glycerophosphotransferase family protein n=1 Tax=Sphaerochaeta sp. TaxID=1972642 RepID=UPI003D0D6F4C
MRDRMDLLVKRWILFLLHAILPRKENRVLFMSFSGSTYSDNPKAISVALRSLYPTIEQCWIMKDPKAKSGVLDPSSIVRKGWSFGALVAMARASVWVFNDTLPGWAWKGSDQYFIQTWHGDRGFKKILYDFSDRAGKPLLQEQFSCDLAIAGSDFGESFFRTAFRYRGEVLKTGCPRNDILVDLQDATIAETQSRLGLEPQYHYVLYAPTLRRKEGKSREAQKVQDIDFFSILEQLGKVFGGSWKFLIRSHVKVPGLVGYPDSDAIIDVTANEDMADLLVVSDMLITDYSSSPGDFALTNRPIILYQNDRKSFEEKQRTFYFDLDDSPFWIVSSQDALLHAIADMPNRNVKQNCEAILAFYKTHETGHSSADVAKRIAQFCKVSLKN